MLGAVLFLITLGLSIAVEYISSKRKLIKDMAPIQHLGNIDKRKRASQQVAFGFFSFLSYLVVVILFVILGFIILKGASVISWDFLTQAPQEGMTSGGIFRLS